MDRLQGSAPPARPAINGHATAGVRTPERIPPPRTPRLPRQWSAPPMPPRPQRYGERTSPRPHRASVGPEARRGPRAAQPDWEREAPPPPQQQQRIVTAPRCASAAPCRRSAPYLSRRSAPYLPRRSAPYLSRRSAPYLSRR